MSLLKSRTFFFSNVLLLKLDHSYTVLEYQRHRLGATYDIRRRRFVVCANYARKLNAERIALLRRPRIIAGLFVSHLPFSVKDATQSPGLGGGSAWTAAIGCAPSREILVASAPGSRAAPAGAVSSDSASSFWTPSCQQTDATFLVRNLPKIACTRERMCNYRYRVR